MKHNERKKRKLGRFGKRRSVSRVKSSRADCDECYLSGEDFDIYFNDLCKRVR